MNFCISPLKLGAVAIPCFSDGISVFSSDAFSTFSLSSPPFKPEKTTTAATINIARTTAAAITAPIGVFFLFVYPPAGRASAGITMRVAVCGSTGNAPATLSTLTRYAVLLSSLSTLIAAIRAHFSASEAGLPSISTSISSLRFFNTPSEHINT